MELCDEQEWLPLRVEHRRKRERTVSLGPCVRLGTHGEELRALRAQRDEVVRDAEHCVAVVVVQRVGQRVACELALGRRHDRAEPAVRGDDARVFLIIEN